MLVLSVLQPQVLGSTVTPMDAKSLADLAGQVITGTVASVDSYWAADPRRIETLVTLQDVEYLKGPSFDASGTFTFVVPGGRVGRTGMQLCRAPTFRIGQRRLLFLLPTFKNFPIVGIYRGSFRVIQDAEGIERIYTESLDPIRGLDEQTRIVVAESAAPAGPRPVLELGVRFRAGPHARRGEQALTYQEFRAALKPILEQSKDHHLTHPAGRRDPAHLSATSLKPAVHHGDAGDVRVEQRPHHRRSAIVDRATRSTGAQRVRKR